MKRCMEVIRHRRDWIRADSPNRQRRKEATLGITRWAKEGSESRGPVRAKMSVG